MADDATRSQSGSRAARLPPSEQALLDRIMGVLDLSPYADETVASSEVCWTLSHFKALHALERKGKVRVEYEQDACWIGRPDA